MIIGGALQETCYGEYQDSGSINRRFAKDGGGTPLRVFTLQIYRQRNQGFPWESEVVGDLLMTAKYGIPIFQLRGSDSARLSFDVLPASPDIASASRRVSFEPLNRFDRGGDDQPQSAAWESADKMSSGCCYLPPCWQREP